MFHASSLDETRIGPLAGSVLYYLLDLEIICRDTAIQMRDGEYGIAGLSEMKMQDGHIWK
jgi:hypothetical protein